MSTRSRPGLNSFVLGDERHQCREPIGAAHVHQRRQPRHQQRRIGRVEGEPFSEQPYVGVTTARAMADVRVKLVEPGYGPTTRFTSNGGQRMEGLIPEPYASFAQPIFAAFAQPAAVTTELDVAEVVWRAANDATGRLRFPAGPDALALAQSR